TDDAERGRSRSVAYHPRALGPAVQAGRRGTEKMRVPLRVATIVTACALLLGAIFAGNIATASPNQFLDKANGHPTFENGKGIAHPSSGTEVSFDDERALMAGVLTGADSDAPPDPAVSVDGTGRAWFSCVLFDVNSNASAVAVTRSTPGLKGAAYSDVAAGASPFIVAETASGAHFFDKEFIAADWRSGQTAVYVTYTDFQASASCKRSFNRGGFCASPIMLSKWTENTDPTKPTPGSWSTPTESSGD